ncbi:hypothetical protein KCP76_13620 [Salmonella enterica subsp. enterica serovar Weltevreden]|nr:hypothetical protein KCP76_13620 [Salmonella enterica subsp. enterica serovar Weltevreden]
MTQKLSICIQTTSSRGFAHLENCQKMQSEERCLFFDAGDYFTGPLSSTLTKRRAIIDILKYHALRRRLCR